MIDTAEADVTVVPEIVLEAISSGISHPSSETLLISIPAAAARIYAIWRGLEFICVGVVAFPPETQRHWTPERHPR